MKKATLICLFILLFAVSLLTGCTVRDSSSSEPGTQSDPVSESADALVTPEPVPTPAPFEIILDQSKPSYVIPESYEQLADALADIKEKEDLSVWARNGNWYLEDLDEAGLAGTRAGEASPAGDIMTTDGEYLYVLADKELLIVKLAADNAEVVSRTKVGKDWTAWESTSDQAVNGSEKVPAALFRVGDKLIVISDYYSYSSQYADMGYTEYTAVDTYDISDPAQPLLLTRYGQEGAPVSAKVWANALILVTKWQYDLDGEIVDPSAYVPCNHYNDGNVDHMAVISPDKLMAVRDGNHAGCSIVGIYDPAAGEMTDERAVYGAPADPFIGDGEIIFFVPRVAEGYSRSYNDPDKGSATEFAAAVCTDLYRFVLTQGDTGYYALAFDGVYTIEGAVEDPRCLDRYNGQLRCAVMIDERRRTDYESGAHIMDRLTSCDILLLDESLKPAFSVADLADGNEDCWVCFLDDRAVVTQAGSLSRLAMLGDTDAFEVKTLARPVTAQAIRTLGDKGCTAFYRSEIGKLTLTVYDEEMQSLYERSFGSDHSSTLENQAGYFADGNSGIVAFSADDSYCFYTFDTEKGLSLKGNVYLSDWAWNARGFILNGKLFVADTRELFICDLTDFSEINRISF